VLISGFGRRGKAKGDIPGVRFKIVKVSGVGLLALWKEKKVRALVTDTTASSDLCPGEAKIINAALSDLPCVSIHVILHMSDSTIIL
jgi:hypothetical protein